VLIPREETMPSARVRFGDLMLKRTESARG